MLKTILVVALLAIAVHSSVDWTDKVTQPLVSTSNGYVQATLGMLESRRAIRLNTSVQALSFQQFFDCSPYGIYNYSYPDAVLTYLKPANGPKVPMHFESDYPTYQDLFFNWDAYVLGMPDPDDPERYVGPVCLANSVGGPTYTIGNYTSLTDIGYNRPQNCTLLPQEIQNGPITIAILSGYQLNYNTTINSFSDWEDICTWRSGFMAWHYVLLVGGNETHWKVRGSFGWDQGDFVYVPKYAPGSTETDRKLSKCNLCKRVAYEHM